MRTNSICNAIGSLAISKRLIALVLLLSLTGMLQHQSVVSAAAAGATVKQVVASSMYNCNLGGYGQGGRLMEPTNWRLASVEKIDGAYQVWTSTTYGPFFLSVKQKSKDSALVKPLDSKSAKIWTKIGCPKTKSITVWYSYVNELFANQSSGHYEKRCKWVETLGGGDQYGMDGNGHISTIKKWVCQNVWVSG